MSRPGGHSRLDIGGTACAAATAVAVHCFAGIGRTGTVLAAYLVAHGECAQDTITEVRRLRSPSLEIVEQVDVVRHYARRRMPL